MKCRFGRFTIDPETRQLFGDGVEIHLGFGHLEGHTALGPYRAEVKEGYAMAIPPGYEVYENPNGQVFLPCS